MNRERVDQVVRAVLYEGYMLYPYRPSVKNRQRWTFGGLFPRAYAESAGTDPWSMQAECLIEGDGSAVVRITVGFLHLITRSVGELCEGQEQAYRVVESLRVGDRVLHGWQEAAEREVALDDLRLGDLAGAPHGKPFAFPAGEELEPVRDDAGAAVGVIVRRSEAIEGVVEAVAEAVGGGLSKLTVRASNLSPLGEGWASRDAAQTRSFASTHAVLGVEGGAFVSVIDPPKAYREAASACRNVGAWPVLVGDEGDRSAMLAAPIILYDYPQVAPESPGDLFDATEIDEILTLRVLTLTEEEKRDAAATDERVRAMLERTEALAREQLMGLHGVLRERRASTESRPDE